MSAPRPTAVVVLAAGAGTRMRSATPKVLHELAGRTLLGHALTTARALEPDDVFVVIGHEHERVAAHLAELDAGAVPVLQRPQLGTADAVEKVLDHLAAVGRTLGGTVIVMFADTPLLAGPTLAPLVEAHEGPGGSDTRDQPAVTILTAVVPDPFGYGRVLRDEGGAVLGSVEERDATPEERSITEVTSGVFAFDADFLAAALPQVGTANAQGERYLPDLIAIAIREGRRVETYALADYRDMAGVNDRAQLASARRRLNDRLLDTWMRAGVTVVDPLSTWVDVDVTLQPDVTLRPGVQLQGATRVAAGASIGPDCTLIDTEVGEGATVVRSHLVSAIVGLGATVGPYAYLRPGATLGPDSKVGTFVEVKASVLGRGTRVPHLSYVGDADIGEETNIGASSVFVNYDGVRKHRTRIGDHCRTGSDTMFIAPVTVGDGAYTAAGSVITNDVPPGAMGVARARQRNVEGWVQRRRPGTAAAAAAARALERQAATEATPAAPAATTTGTTAGGPGTGSEPATIAHGEASRS